MSNVKHFRLKALAVAIAMATSANTVLANEDASAYNNLSEEQRQALIVSLEVSDNNFLTDESNADFSDYIDSSIYFQGANFALTTGLGYVPAIGSGGSYAIYYGIEWASYMLGELFRLTGNEEAGEYLPQSDNWKHNVDLQAPEYDIFAETSELYTDYGICDCDIRADMMAEAGINGTMGFLMDKFVMARSFMMGGGEALFWSLPDFYTSYIDTLDGGNGQFAESFYNLTADYRNDDQQPYYVEKDHDYTEYFETLYIAGTDKKQDPSGFNSWSPNQKSNAFVGFNRVNSRDLGDYYISIGTAIGGGGDDVFIDVTDARGGEGNDSFLDSKEAFGNNGDDLFENVGKAVGGSGNDYFHKVDNASGGLGDDTIIGSISAKAGDGNDYIINALNSYGGNGDDFIVGSSFIQQHHYGDAGHDTIMGGKGADIIFGGSGDDVLSDRYDSRAPAQGLVTYIDGGEGTDHLRLVFTETGQYAYSGAGSVNYRSPFELLDALPSTLLDRNTSVEDDYKLDYQHRIFGQHMNMPNVHINNVEKILIVNEAINATFNFSGMTQEIEFEGYRESDYVAGSNVNDLLRGGQGDDTLAGGDGDDVIDGGSGNDQLYGGRGNDIIFPGQGEDIVKGNAGYDSVSYANAIGAVDIDLAQTKAYQHADGLTDKIYGIRHVFASPFGGEITGDKYNNSLVGNGGNDTLNGGDGNDLLDGRAGDDVLAGGNGNDTLIAGSGKNELTGGSGRDNFVISTLKSNTNSTTIRDFNDVEDKITLDAHALGIFLENGEANLGYDENGNARTLTFRSSTSELGFSAGGSFSAIAKLNVSNFDVANVEFYKLVESLGETDFDMNLRAKQSVSHSSKHFYYPTLDETPVVITSAPTTNGGQGGVLSIRDVTSGSFYAKFAEWRYLDGAHATEKFDYLTMPMGRHTMSDGSIFEVGAASVRGDRRYTAVSFSQRFATTPLVFAVKQTNNAPDEVVAVRVKNVSPDGFTMAMYREDGLEDNALGKETIGYIAFEPANADGGTFYHNGKSVSYNTYMAELDHTEKRVGQYVYRLQEDQAQDSETEHSLETVNVLELGGTAFIQQISSTGSNNTAIRRK